MGTLLLLILLTLPAGIIFYNHIRSIYEEANFGIILLSVLLSLSVGSFLTVMIVLFLMHIEPEGERYGYETTKIYSLSIHNDHKNDSCFTLGSKIIRDEIYYYYYKQYKTPDAYQMDKIKADDVVLFADKRPPCLRRQLFKRQGFWKFMFGDTRRAPKTELHIPYVINIDRTDSILIKTNY